MVTPTLALLSLAWAAQPLPLPKIPRPAGSSTGAVCHLTLHFDDGEQTRVDVPPACPEPFRAAVRTHFESTPLVVEGPPALLDLRVSFVVGQAEAPVERREDEPGAFARPAPGSTVHLPETLVRFKKHRWPRKPGMTLSQPVVCRALLDFDADGLAVEADVRGCPPELAAATREAIAQWKVHPDYLDVPILVRTQVAITYGP